MKCDGISSSVLGLVCNPRGMAALSCQVINTTQGFLQMPIIMLSIQFKEYIVMRQLKSIHINLNCFQPVENRTF